MAMEQIGCVAQVNEKEVKIRVMRESACGGNCGACHGCPTGAVLISYPNDPINPFVVGETVVITMASSQFIEGTLYSYGLLTLTMILGAILGYCMTHMEIISVLGAFGGLTIGVLLMRYVTAKKTGTFYVKRQNEGKNNENI